MSRRRWPCGWLLAVVVVFAAGAQEQPQGAPQPDHTPRDPEFGVVARHLGLERQVEMLQWQASGTGYRLVWSQVAIDSGRFAPGHDNPGAMPLQGRRWLSREVTVDGKPLDPSVLHALGQWRPFRPSFSALPGNLSATFQPEGTGLGSAENPLRPVVGDLRIHWRELVLPPLDGRLVLRDGRWVLAAGTVADPVVVDADTTAASVTTSSRARWVGAIAAFLIALMAIAAARRRRK